MSNTVFLVLIALGSTGAALFVFTTGVWRKVLAPFGIRARKMTVSRLRLAVTIPENVVRVETILHSFAAGFNTMLMSRSRQSALTVCNEMPALLQPFAHEGLAMGYTPRALMRFDGVSFERDIVKPKPEFRYLYYVGLGFWSGMRNHDSAKVSRIVNKLDPLHRFLVFDGYGFKVAFFDAPSSRSALARLSIFEGYAAHAAWQGVGRALYFRYLDTPAAMIEQIRECGDHAVDAAAGVGLASVFVNPDRLERALTLADVMPAEWRAHVHLGMCFGLKARSINNLDQFESDIARLDLPAQEAVWSSIRECDRIELLVRSDAHSDGYRAWREQVTAWMERHIEYPLRSLRGQVRETSGHKGNSREQKGHDELANPKGVAG